MSKQTLNKFLKALDREQMTEFVVEMYTNSKKVKEYIDHFLDPDIGIDILTKYKKIIEKEFYPKNPMNAGLKYSVTKKAIKDFADLKPDPIFLSELMLYLPELASKFTHDYGDMTEQYYISAENNFNAALRYIAKNGLLKHFKEQAKSCVQYASRCGYGFSDAMNDIYYSYY
jgi:hypothetical protein